MFKVIPRQIDSPPIDLTNCDKEPIHIPGCIQPHGMLLVLNEPELEIIQVSANAEQFLGRPPAALLGQSIASVLEPSEFMSLAAAVKAKKLDDDPTFLCKIARETCVHAPALNMVLHRTHGVLALELEPARVTSESEYIDLMCLLRNSFVFVREEQAWVFFWQKAAEAIKALSGFDRVMIYEFEQNGNGTVTAEVKEEGLEPFLGLHYPASDIPQQARQLYLKNSIRLIPNVGYEPVSLLVRDALAVPQLLDMSYVSLRSVSPIHLQYLKNMGVVATMTISLIDGDKLWGLIACHHYSPRQIPFEVQTACSMLGQFVALEYSSRMQQQEHLYQLKLQEMESRFIEFMSHSESFSDGLLDFSPNLSDFINAEGAILYDGSVIIADQKIRTVGLIPPEAALYDLIHWLDAEMSGPIYYTHELPKVYPPALAYKDCAAGLMAVSISTNPSNYMLWFRPECVQTVSWAGDPAQSKVKLDSNETLTPRASFALWQETVQLKSLPWTPYECFAALEIRDIVRRMQLFKTEELTLRNQVLEKQVAEKTQALAKSNKELEQFATIASHDLQAPLRKVSIFSDFLKQNLSSEFSAENKDYLERIQKATQKMQALIDGLLNLSRVNRKAGTFQWVDLRDEMVGAMRDLEPLMQSTQGVVEIGETISIECDRIQMHQLFQNLIENALKFHRDGVPPIVRVNAKALDSEVCEILVSDNGLGFDEKYLDRIFGVFERLHGVSAYEGTGIGLSIVQKVVDRHHGTITATSSIGEGSTFMVRLPIHQRKPAV